MSQVFNSLSGEFECLDEVIKLEDWNLEKAFNEWRHTLRTEKEPEFNQEVSRVKERLKTISVALVLCLNVGVDPPDVVKPVPCAKTECWVDPFTMPPDKALDIIAYNLLKQYENYHPKARYKLALDLKLDDVKKLCTSLRRNAKDDRVLFHYNGHGVPRATNNGEIWVFNKDYTQYLPLSIYDLQTWMGPNSVYVFDCSAAGEIIRNFKNFVSQREQEYALIINPQKQALDGHGYVAPPPNFNNSILFGACGADQILPMNPELPADLFTCCLTAPIKTSLKYYMIQKSNRLLPEITDDLIDNIPGQLSDRRTMLGELNWILTAIVDSIAWDILPKETFQKMFRQDLLVSLLSRHFILAQRIMSSYDCTPICSPEIPAAPKHPMWATWDYVLDQCLSQLPTCIENPSLYVHSTFFTEQLTAFQTWLSFGARIQSELKPKVEQLPIVLQVLLSHLHRLRALELFSRFLSLGDWAVDMALSVGIFPYILKLLQSQDRELRPLLVYMWSKIFALDFSAQNDLVYDNAYKYFLQVLGDTTLPSDFRTMAAFVLACFVRNFEKGQNLAFKGSLLAICLEQLNDQNPLLRQWLCICLGLTWNNCREAKWCGVRDSAHEKLFVLLSDPVPDVRASAVFALGTFINLDKTDHSNTIDETIGIKLIHSVGNDGNPLVRKELIAALQWLVLFFEKRFVSVAYQMQEEEKRKNKDDNTHLSPTDLNNLTITSTTSLLNFGIRKSSSRERLSKLNSPVKDGKFVFGNSDSTPPSNNLMKRVSSSNSLSTFTPISYRGIENVYVAIWKQLNILANDPHHEVSHLANIVLDRIKSKLVSNETANALTESHSDPSFSEPSSPITNSFLTESMQKNASTTSKKSQQHRDSTDACMINNNNRKDRQSSETILNPTQQISSSSFTNNPRERQSSEGSNGPLNRLIKNNPQLPILQYTHTYTKRKIFGKEEPNADKINPSHDKETNCKTQPLVETYFIGWCIKYFNEYSLKYTERSDQESEYNQRREWKCLQNAAIRKNAKEELIRIDASKTDELIFSQKSINLPNLIQFHPYEPYLFVAEHESFSIWNCESNQTNSFLGNFSNSNSPNSKITSMQLINSTEWTATMFGCDDGSVRLWKLHSITPTDYTLKPKLVTAFNLFQDTSLKTTGTLLQWEQKNLNLIAASDNKICIWDAVKEMKVRDLVTGSDSPPVNTLHSNDANLICAGCADGSLRIFDKKSQNNLTFRSLKSSPIVNAHIFQSARDDKYIISGSASGDIKFWDKRNQSKPVRQIHLPGNVSMAAMSVHPTADVFACATNTANQAQIYIYNLDGMQGSIIKYRIEGFISQHLAPVSCLTYHPFKANLALGSTDSFINIFTSTRTTT